MKSFFLQLITFLAITSNPDQRDQLDKNCTKWCDVCFGEGEHVRKQCKTIEMTLKQVGVEFLFWWTLKN